MISCKYAISDEQGLHVTNAMSPCRAASDYESSIALRGGRESADCKNVLALMNLGVRQEECLELLMKGPDGDQVADFLQGLMHTILRSTHTIL